MPTFINTQGQVVDATTGEVVGRTETAPTQAEPRKAGPEQVTEGADKVKGLVNNLSWGFNSALFALPDAAQRVIGRGLGLDDNQTFQFAKFFNRGEVNPKNSGERYARAVGEGVGNALPFTGILGAVAASRPLVTATVAPSGVLRGVADDAIKMIQQSPRAAAAMDVAFGAGWEGLRQAVEENVDDNNPNKALIKELLPTAAFVGAPLALSMMGNRGKQIAGMLPSVKAANWAKEQVAGGRQLSDVEQEALAAMPKGWRLPIVNIVPKFLIKNAENKLTQVFGPIAESKEAQEALSALEAAMADPRFGQAGFVFDAAEKTMYAPLVQEKIKLLEQMGPKELEGIKDRINQNQMALDRLFSNLAPDARKPVMEAFQAAQADRQAFFESLLRQKADLTDAEIASISERLGPQDPSKLGNELRGVIMGNMEWDNAMRQKVLSRAGIKQALAPDGTPLPTREMGKSLYPSQDMEDAALALIQKYKPERPSMRMSVPEPVRLLDNFVQSQMAQRQKMENQMLTQLVDETLTNQLGNMGKEFDPEITRALRDSVMTLVRGEKPKTGRRTPGIAELAPTPDAQGNIAIPAIIPGRRIIVNPAQLRQDAARIAEANTPIDLSIPEALDYLTAAQRFRNDSLSNYNAAMMKGRTRQTDAQRILDTGNSVFTDVERLVLGHAPRLKGQSYETMKMMLDDYKQVYARTLPLLMTGGKRGGMEYFLPNEDLLRNAFKSADSVKQVANILGNDEQSASLMMKGTIDWLRSKGVVNDKGLVDPNKIRSVLDKNRNIVDALPQNIQAKLTDEVALADDYVRRIGELDQRAVTAQDNELDRVLAKAVRPEADPRMVMTDALKDPAIMRKLVDVVGKDPEMLSALRRSVYDIATEGAQGGGSLKSFLDQNEKALKVLYGGTEHLDNLKKLADMQRRVSAFANVTGQIPAFESLDAALKRSFGFGVQFGTTTMREALVGRISPETGAMALLLRMTGSLENQLYKRIFTKALESEQFAKQITHVATPKDATKVEKELADLGISKNMIFQGESKMGQLGRQGVQQVGGDIMRSGEQKPIAGMAGQPVVPRETASQMLRKLPPAPPTSGTQFSPRMATKPQVTQGAGAGQIPLMYPAMFPNDPISALLQQRQAMTQPPQQPQQ